PLPAEEPTRSDEPTFTTMRRKSLSDGAFCTIPTELFMAALCSMGLPASSSLGVTRPRDPSIGSCSMQGMVSSCRGRSDAACSLWRRAGDCAWQRTAGTRLAVGADVADGRYQSGLERRSPTRTGGADGERQRSDHSARTGNPGKRRTTDHFANTDTPKSEYRSADHPT